MMKAKRVKDSEWKPVILEGTILSNDIAGLIGIEELTDYNLERSSKRGNVVTTQVTSAKQTKVSMTQ